MAPVFRLAGLSLLASLVASAPAQARKLKLDELIELARTGNAGLQAADAATAAMEAQINEARRNAWPTGELTSLIAPSPEVRCRAETPAPPGEDPQRWREQHCLTTNVSEARINVQGVFTRTDLKLVQPLFTFGKIDAGIAAAEAGTGVARQRAAGQRADLELSVQRAYWGLKLSRAVTDTLDEGIGYLDEAQKKIEKELAEGTGTATVTDKLRLRTVRAEADARRLEARRLGNLAQSGLRTLLGASAPSDLDIDDEDLDPVDVPERPLANYEEQARLHRPEVRLLDHAVAARRALADLERRKAYPDLVLVGTFAYGYASSVDNPQNAFWNHSFNTLTGGLAAALRMPLDLGPKFARADRTAAEANEVDHRRREALGGIALEVDKAYGELTEAAARVTEVHKGEKAGKAWITAVAQNFELGLAETRDFSDALSAFFQMRVRYLQSVYDHNVAAAALARATGTEVVMAKAR